MTELSDAVKDAVWAKGKATGGCATDVANTAAAAAAATAAATLRDGLSAAATTVCLRGGHRAGVQPEQTRALRVVSGVASRKAGGMMFAERGEESVLVELASKTSASIFPASYCTVAG